MNSSDYYQESFIARWLCKSLNSKELEDFQKWLTENPDDKAYFSSLKNIWARSGQLQISHTKSKQIH